MSAMTGIIPLKVRATHNISLDVDGPRTTTTLRQRRSALAGPEVQLSTLASVPLSAGPSASGRFSRDLKACGWPVLKPKKLEIFQMNLGKLCNMTCRHCHVDAGPDRLDAVMDRETADACIEAIVRSGAHTVDLTGGAPELNPHFAHIVDALVARGKHVMDRCNLTILTTSRFRHLPEWFAERGVEIVCSLPHFRRSGTDVQRGDGTFDKSIEALRMLNSAGYGQGDPGKRLVLVTNPVGAFLSGDQDSLETDWKRALQAEHGVRFDALLALNNMPISRYLEWLLDRGLLEEYMIRLANAFNPATIAGLMCRNTLSVSWDGRVFDCDFNQMLELELEMADGSRPHIREFDADQWLEHEIATHRHCYGCTAGAGSSCGGSIST